MSIRDDGCGSAGSCLFRVVLLRGALMHEFPVDGHEDSLLAFAESRVSLGGLGHRHDGLGVQLVARGIAEVLSKGGRGEAEYPLQLNNPFRLRCGLAGEPLRDRGLGDAKRGGKLPLGQAALATSTLERPCEVAPLIGRRHVLVLSRAGTTVNRMPDQAITGRFPRPDNFLVIRRPLVTYTGSCNPGQPGAAAVELRQGEAP
jgi:hypothetical protein